MTKRENRLRKIAGQILTCRECRKGGTGKAVPGEGTGEAGVLFVGEAPGRTEAATGRPFVGRSGALLRSMICRIGLDEKKVFITSPVHYLPVTGKPSPAMIDHGRLHLLEQIEAIDPDVIVLLGSTACRALLGRNTEISKEHGTVREQNGKRCFITFHPAYAMRFPEGRKKFVQDFKILQKLLGPPKEKGSRR